MHKIILTRYLGGFLEGFSQVRINLDHLVLLAGHNLISNLNLLFNPSLKVVLDHRIDDVAQKLLGELVDLIVVGQVLVNLVVLLAKLGDLVEREQIILWDSYVPNF